jgi:3-hydroxyisobutyrate dehydrogenase-like beta-hydroxyacid dehydrogenase
MPREQHGESAVLNDILRQLELLVNLISLQVASEKSVTEGARLLKMAGLDNQTVADVLNTTPKTVRSLTTKLRVKILRQRN